MAFTGSAGKVASRRDHRFRLATQPAVCRRARFRLFPGHSCNLRGVLEGPDCVLSTGELCPLGLLINVVTIIVLTLKPSTPPPPLSTE